MTASWGIFGAFFVVMHAGAIITGLSTPPVPPVPILTLHPSSPTVPDNVPAGYAALTVTVTMSDGSAFNGTIQVSDTTGLFGVSGMNIVTGRDLTPEDDGSHVTTITAQ